MTIARRGFVALGAAAATTGMGLRPAAAADKTIVLGCSIPLSGPAAPTGITTQRTIEHAVEPIDARGIMVGADRYTLVPVVGKTTEAKVLQLSGASGKEHLTGPKFPSGFRVQPTNETAYAVYPWLKTAFPDVERVAHMNPSDEAGFTESEDRRMISAKNGFTNVGNEYFQRGSTDMYPVATDYVRKARLGV